MTNEEATKLVYILQAAYPQHYRDFDAGKTRNLVTVWRELLEDYTYEQAAAGLKAFMANDTKGFPPVAGQIIDYLHKGKEQMSAIEAWGLVYKAIQNGTYGAEEEYAKLPPIIQKAIGNPANIREMAQMDVDAMSVEQSHFIRSYNAAVAREKEIAKIPQAVRDLIAGTTAMIEERS